MASKVILYTNSPEKLLSHDTEVLHKGFENTHVYILFSLAASSRVPSQLSSHRPNTQKQTFVDEYHDLTSPQKCLSPKNRRRSTIWQRSPQPQTFRTEFLTMRATLCMKRACMVSHHFSLEHLLITIVSVLNENTNIESEQINDKLFAPRSEECYLNRHSLRSPIQCGWLVHNWRGKWEKMHLQFQVSSITSKFSSKRNKSYVNFCHQPATQYRSCCKQSIVWWVPNICPEHQTELISG